MCCSSLETGMLGMRSCCVETTPDTTCVCRVIRRERRQVVCEQAVARDEIRDHLRTHSSAYESSPVSSQSTDVLNSPLIASKICAPISTFPRSIAER